MNMPRAGALLAPHELLTLLAERRVYLAAHAGGLGFRARAGAVDSPLREQILPYRDDLLQALKGLNGPVLLCPLSFNQQSLFFLHLLEPQSSAYHLAFTIELRPSADAMMLKTALARLMDRHEQLRTTYGHVRLGEELLSVQFVHASLAPVFETVDGRSWRDGEAADRVREFYQRPFDISQGAPLRAALFDRGPERSIFMVVVHHIAADAWSLGVIRRDLEHACLGELGKEETALSGSEYIDFTLSQHRLHAEAGGKAHLEYWTAQHRQPAPSLEVSDASRRPRVRRSFGATCRFRIEQDLRQAVEDAAREQGMTSFALLLAVFQWQFMERSGGHDVVIGIPTLGRNDRRYEYTVGYFVNPIPLRCRRSDPCSFRDHAGRTAQELRVALEHRATPFAAVVEQLGGGRDTSRTPLFQIMFNLLSRRTMGDALDLFFPAEGNRKFDFAGRTATAWGLDQQEGQFDLTLELVDQGDHLQGFWKYCTDLFTSAEAEAMAAEFVGKLQEALVTPDRSLFSAAGREVQNAEAKPATIAVAATFTAEMLQDFYEFWSERLNYRTHVLFAPFNQVFQALLGPSSLLRTNRRGHNIVLLRLEDFLADHDAEGTVVPAAAQVLDELRQAVAVAAGSMAVPLCLALCPPSPARRVIAEYCEGELQAFLQAIREIPGVTVITHDDISSIYPVLDYHEPLGEDLGRIPYTRSYFAALATTTMRMMHARNRQPVKALVLDCDGTLWDGVAAEEGPAGVTVGPQQRRFQEILLELHRAGVILGICSKNRDADVWAVFDQHPDMLLRREHVGFWRINWEPKSLNIRALREEMNIGLDAIAFFDDNPVERAEVRAQCPSVVCPELPETWEERTDWIRHLWLLDQGTRTAEDRKRQEQYRTDHLRDDLRQQADSFREFLDRLGLEVRLQPATTANYERLAQLSVRTNQFNTTVQRYTVQEIAEYCSVDGRSVHTAHVSDRFGDYGLVGGMLTRADNGTLRVDNLFLSCRALGRGVENRMVAYLGTYAHQAGCTYVAFQLRITDRNEPARNFLARLGRLLDGTVDEQGLLIVSAERLINAPYDEILTSSGGESPEKVPALSASMSGTDLEDRDRLFRIADELRSVDAIVRSVDRMLLEGTKQKHRKDGSGPVIVPASQTEQLIADIWKRVLSIDAVSTRSNFFDLGGTSLLMARIAIELGRDHGREVTLVDLFQYPTIADLARHLDGSGTAGDAVGRAEVSALRQRTALRGNLSPGFQRLKEARG